VAVVVGGQARERTGLRIIVPPPFTHTGPRSPTWPQAPCRDPPGASKHQLGLRCGCPVQPGRGLGADDVAPVAGLLGAAGLGGPDVAAGSAVDPPRGGSPEPMEARRRSPRREAPERAGESNTAQVVRSSARLAADIATLQTAGVPTGREPPQHRQVQHAAALLS
jgi:hypothetical protein